MKKINDPTIVSAERKDWISDLNPATDEELRLLGLVDEELEKRQAAGEDIVLTELPTSFAAREEARRLEFMQRGFAPDAGMKSDDVYTMLEFDDANAAGEIGRLPVVLEKAELPDEPGQRAKVFTRVRADELGLREARLLGEERRMGEVRIHVEEEEGGRAEEEELEEAEGRVEALRASMK